VILHTGTVNLGIIKFIHIYKYNGCHDKHYFVLGEVKHLHRNYMQALQNKATFFNMPPLWRTRSSKQQAPQRKKRQRGYWSWIWQWHCQYKLFINTTFHNTDTSQSHDHHEDNNDTNNDCENTTIISNKPQFTPKGMSTLTKMVTLNKTYIEMILEL